MNNYFGIRLNDRLRGDVHHNCEQSEAIYADFPALSWISSLGSE